jgi:uncharacterized OsmC-like protein
MDRSASSSEPEPETIRRQVIIEADAETLERMRKEGHVRGFTIHCDEREDLGGDNSAPSPLGYFCSALAF